MAQTLGSLKIGRSYKVSETLEIRSDQMTPDLPMTPIAVITFTSHQALNSDLYRATQSLLLISILKAGLAGYDNAISSNGST